MNLSAIKIITVNTILNEWRSKALIFLGIMTTLALMIAVVILTFVNENYIEGMNLDSVGLKALGVFFIFINFWSYLISIYFGVSSVKTDTEYSVLPQILSFPIDRSEYLVGRILGTLTIVMGYYLISLVFAIVAISIVIKSVVFSPLILVGFLVNIIPNFIVILLSFAFGPYIGKLQSFMVMIFMTLFISVSNGRFTNMAMDAMVAEEGIFSKIQLFVHTFFPHISIWGGLGNQIILEDVQEFNTMLEVPHLLITGFLLYFLVYKRFKNLEV